MLSSSGKYLFILILTFSYFPAEGQILIHSCREDIEKLISDPSGNETHTTHRTYLYKGEYSLARKLNPAGWILGGSLYVYQNVFSKHISADCLYHPSCSEFSKTAIRESGILPGILLSIDRVNRCNIISGQDLKRYGHDLMRTRFPDPVTRYIKPRTPHE